MKSLKRIFTYRDHILADDGETDDIKKIYNFETKRRI